MSVPSSSSSWAEGSAHSGERLHESLRRPVPPGLQERLATFKRLTGTWPHTSMRLRPFALAL